MRTAQKRAASGEDESAMVRKEATLLMRLSMPGMAFACAGASSRLASTSRY